MTPSVYGKTLLTPKAFVDAAPPVTFPYHCSSFIFILPKLNLSPLPVPSPRSLKACDAKEGDVNTSWVAGQELGVDALVDDVGVWPHTVTVKSDRAVLLELKQSDLQVWIACR